MKTTRKIKRLTAPIAIVAITISSSGCSVIGLGAGAAVGANKPDYITVEKKHADSIKPYTRTIVHTNDGSRKIGKFAGFKAKSLIDTLGHDPDSSVSAVQKGILLNYNGIPESLSIYGEYINLDNVTSIEGKNPKHAKWIGLAIGLEIDMVVLMVAISNMKFDISLEGEMN